MSDSSFILQGPASSELKEYARDLQALLDNRTAGIEQPVSGSQLDLDLMLGQPAEPAEQEQAT